MKKFTAILLTVIMVASLFTSCSNSIAPNIDETVSVSFDESTSRSLTASLDEFKANKYFWAYKAEKKDNTGLISGQTEFAWVNGNNKGLAGVTIPGFSQGIWEFTLYAYTTYETETANLKLAYSGVTETTLQKNSSNIIKVTVNPNPQGNGTLIIDVSKIEINPQVSDPAKFDQGNFVKVVKVTSLADDSDKPVPENKTLSLPAGAYKVTVEIKEPGNDLVYASGSVVATVYANMTTTVSGNLDEYIVPAQFDPSINPDVMNKVVYSDSVDSRTSGDVVISKKTTTGSETDSKVTATIPSAIAQLELGKAITENSSSAGATGSNTSIVFSLSVDTTNATEDSLSLEIGMNAIITVKESETSEKQISKEISTLDNYVTVKIQLQTGLRNVAVTHDSAAMQKLTSLNEAITNENGAYFYDADSGLMTIKTKKFSPYAITYTVPEEAYVAEMNGVKYTSVQAAINAAPEKAGNSISTITILNNVTAGPAFGFPDSMKNTGKNILIDLNGHTYTFKDPAMGSTGTASQAMHLIGGNKLTVKDGILNVASDSEVIKMLIMNYCDLTLENVIIDGSNLSNAIYGTTPGPNYTASFNYGSNVVITGNTQIIARPVTTIAHRAFDVDPSGGEVKVTFDKDFIGSVVGTIEYLSSKGISNDYLAIAGNGCFDSSFNVGTSVNLYITGGTFSSNPSEYVASGYEAIESEGQWNVSRKVLAKNGDTSYYTLEDAIEAADDGDTITLTSDIEKTVSSVKGSCYAIENKSITIDGQNHKLTLKGLFEGESASGTEAYGIKISGKDSGKTVTLRNMKIDAINIQRAVRTEDNISVTIDHCTISTNGCGIHVKGANTVDICNNTTITVSVNNNEKYTAHLRTGVMVGGPDAVVKVNGCTINASNLDKTENTHTWCKGLYVGAGSENAKITAKNTTVTADYSIAIDGSKLEKNPTQIVIESGTYTGVIGTPGGYSYKSLTINDGTFFGLTNLDCFYGKDNKIAKLVISGGTFPFNPDTKYISDGCKSTANENGTWTVTQDSSN